MGCLGNIIWLLFGGIFIAIEYCIVGVLFCISIIGIPWGLQCFKFAIVALWPFGTQVINNPNTSSSGCLNTLMNVIWIFIGGIWICLTHLFFGIVLCITMIAIPFGRQHFKLAGLCLTPFGKSVV